MEDNGHKSLHCVRESPGTFYVASFRLLVSDANADVDFTNFVVVFCSSRLFSLSRVYVVK